MKSTVIFSGDVEIVAIGNGLFYSIENKKTGQSVFLQNELDVSAFRIAMESVSNYNLLWDYMDFDLIADRENENQNEYA